VGGEDTGGGGYGYGVLNQVFTCGGGGVEVRKFLLPSISLKKCVTIFFLIKPLSVQGGHDVIGEHA
jgi:hypothetical protein